MAATYKMNIFIVKYDENMILSSTNNNSNNNDDSNNNANDGSINNNFEFVSKYDWSIMIMEGTHD